MGIIFDYLSVNERINQFQLIAKKYYESINWNFEKLNSYSCESLWNDSENHV